MSYAKELLTAELTDWLSPLEKIYTRQTKQLQEHHSALRDRDKQLVEKAEAENIPDLVKNLATFSTSISKLKDAREASKLKKDEEAKAELAVRLAQLGNVKDINSFTRRVSQSENLKTSFKDYKAAVIESFPGAENEARRQFLFDQHGSKFYRLEEAMGHRDTQNIIPLWQEYINKPENRAIQAEYDSKDGDPIAQQSMVSGWFYNERLGKRGLGFDSKFIAEKFHSSVNKALNTKGVMQGLQYTQLNLTAEEENLNTRVDVAISQLIDNPNALTFEIQTQILEGVDESKGIDVAKSREIVVNRLIRLGKEGGLQQHELDLLKTGRLPIPYGGNELGTALFKSDQIHSIQKAIDAKNNQVWEASKAANITAGKAAYSTIVTNAGNLPQAKLQEIKDEGLQLMARTIGTNNDTYRQLEALDVSLHTPGSYNRIKAQYQDLYNGSGDILQREEEIKKIPQGKVRAELIEKLEETKRYLASAGLPSTFDELQKASRDILIDATGGTLKRDSVLSEDSKALQRWLTKKRLEIHLNAKDKIPNPKEAALQAEKEFTEFRDSHGINVIDEKNPKGVVGILSSDIHGEFPRFKDFREAKVENNAAPSLYMEHQWLSNTGKLQKEHKGNTEDLLNTSVLKLVNEDDVYGSFIEGDKLFYSPELVVKSLKLGRQPGYVLQKALEKMIADDHPYVKRYGLEDKLEILKNAPDLKLRELLEKHGDKNYVAQYNYRGITSFSNKQLQRLMSLDDEQIAEQIKNKRIEQRIWNYERN